MGRVGLLRALAFLEMFGAGLSIWYTNPYISCAWGVIAAVTVFCLINRENRIEEMKVSLRVARTVGAHRLKFVKLDQDGILRGNAHRAGPPAFKPINTTDNTTWWDNQNSTPVESEQRHKDGNRNA